MERRVVQQKGQQELRLAENDRKVEITRTERLQWGGGGGGKVGERHPPGQ